MSQYLKFWLAKELVQLWPLPRPNHDDRWLVAKAYFEANFEALEEEHD